MGSFSHFQKANFVSSAVVEDCLYDTVYALNFALERFKFLYPTETPTEKRIKLFYEEEVGAKSTSVGSFNMYFNLSTTTDAMKTIVSVSKNVFKNKASLMRTSNNNIASIACTGFI